MTHQGESSKPHAHHLKYGAIETATFSPAGCPADAASSSSPPSAAHLAAVSHAATLDEPARRRMMKDRSMELLDAHARRIHQARRYLIRKPRALQYFRGRTLVRDDDERTSSRLELFFDLTFVGLIASIAEEAIHEPTGAGLARYLITFTMSYFIWSFMRELFDSFYTDDLTQRVLVLIVMIFLVVFGNNAVHIEYSRLKGPSRATAIGAYLVAEFAMFLTYVLYSFHIKAYRAQLRAHALTWVFTSALWIGAIFAELRVAIALAVLALCLEWISWIVVYTPWFKNKLKLRFSSAINIEHEVERFNDFLTLVMGEFLYSVFSGSPTGQGLHASAGRAAMAVCIAFCFQLFYMQGGGSKAYTHALRSNIWLGITWFTLHMPIVSALTLCGDSMAELTKELAINNGVRWIACETYAVGMIGMWVLAWLETETDKPGELWIPKRLRLLPRLVAGVVAVFLPLSRQPGHVESHAAAEGVTSLVHRAVAAAAEAVGGAGAAATESHAASGGGGLDTSALLGILSAMSLAALLWEMVSSLDGPNAPHERAPDHVIALATDGTHTKASALQTPAWSGRPRLVEPGAGIIDRSHQRRYAATPAASQADLRLPDSADATPSEEVGQRVKDDEMDEEEAVSP